MFDLDFAKPTDETVVVLVAGEPRTGKTVFANGVCRMLGDFCGWRTYCAAARRTVDGYDGSEIMLVDDVPNVRDSALGVEDWLKRLDPARPAPRVVILTGRE